MFKSSIIKPKKSKLLKTESIPSGKIATIKSVPTGDLSTLKTASIPTGKLPSIKTMAEMEEEHGAEEMAPKEKYEVSEKPEMYKKPSKKSEDIASLEMSLASAKKKPEQKTEFVEHGGSMLQHLQPKDPEARKKYLEKIKSKKGM